MPFLLTDAIFLIIHLSPQLSQLLPNKELGGKKCPLSAVSPPFPPIFPLCASLKTTQCLWLFLAVFYQLVPNRRQRKDKTGHSPRGSVIGYSDPANEKLLPGPRNGTINHR